MAGKMPKLYLQLGWRMAVAMAAAFAVAYLFTADMPDKFSARALLLLSPLPFEYTDDVPGAVSTQAIDSRRVSYVKVTSIAPLAMPDYRLLLTSEDTAAKLVERLKPIYEKKGLSTSGLTPQSIMGSLDLRHKTLLTTNIDVKYQQVAELFVTAGNAELAAETANAWADVCVEVAKEVRQAAGQGAVDVLSAQTEEVQKKLDAVREEISRLEGQIDVDNRVQLEALDQEEILQESLLKELKVSLNAAELVTRDAAPEFKVVSRAIPPAGPSGPDRRLYMVIAVFLAAVGAPVLFFTLGSLQRYARLYEAEAEKP